MAECDPEELMLESILRIDEKASTNNFRMIPKCMSSFKMLTDSRCIVIVGCGQLEKTNKLMMEEFGRMRKKEEKDFI